MSDYENYMKDLFKLSPVERFVFGKRDKECLSHIDNYLSDEYVAKEMVIIKKYEKTKDLELKLLLKLERFGIENNLDYFLFSSYVNFINEWKTIIIILSIASMFLGAVAAIGQNNLKRLMAYSSIGHVGFILAGLAIATPQSLSAVLVYIVIYVFMNIGVFACIMCLNRNGVYFENISDLSGLSKHHPLIAVCLTILTFSLAGIPPLAGFFAKFYIFLAIIQQKIYYLAVIGLLSAVIAAFYYLRIIKVIYFDPAKESYDKKISYGLKFSLIVSTVVVLFYFIDPSTLNTIVENITKNIK